MILHHKVSTLLVVNEARRELFCKKNKSLENLLPTQDALLQHARRAVFQTNIWTTMSAEYPTPEDWGWRKQENSWKPIWMTLLVHETNLSGVDASPQEAAVLDASVLKLDYLVLTFAVAHVKFSHTIAA